MIQAKWFRSRDPWETATFVLLIAVAAVMCVTFRDYGVSWDEQFSHIQGEDFLSWYASGFRDRSVIEGDFNEYLYGGLFNAVAVFVGKHSPFGTHEGIHLLIAATGFLGIVFTYRTGKLLAGSMAGFLAALILTLTPTFYGHFFMNPKDIPFAVFFLVAVYYLIRAYDHLPRLGMRAVIATGTAIGLALAVRAAGLFLLGYIVVLVGFWLIAQLRKNPSFASTGLWSSLGNAGVGFILVSAVAWVWMVVWWPFAQLDPVLNPLRVFLTSARYSDWRWTVLYRGEYFQSSALPWHYLPGSLLVTLPEFYVIGLFAGAAALCISIGRREQNQDVTGIDRRMKLGFFVFATFFPLAAVLATRPIMYDGTRLFLFLIPPLAVASGVGLAWFFSKGVLRFSKFVLASVLLIVGAATILDMVRLHPYEYVFFNRSAGGLRGAAGMYETDYWGTSYKDGVEWLIGNYKPGAAKGSITVSNDSNPFLTSYYLRSPRPETQRFLPVNSDGDVMLSLTRWNQHLRHPGRVLHVVERMGVPLLYVIEVARSPRS